MKLSAIKIDAAAAEAGVWIRSIAGMGDLGLFTRGVGNADWRRLQDKLTAAVPLNKRVAGAVDPEERDRIITELLIETALLGWEGIEDETGEPLPYSKAQARELISNPDYRQLRDAAFIAAAQAAEQRAAAKDADAKN